MTKEDIFLKIDDVYCENDGGDLYLTKERENQIKEIIQQAIDFIPCCTELKGKEVLTFEDWTKQQGYKQDFFYFKKDKEYLKPTQVLQKYNKYKQKL